MPWGKAASFSSDDVTCGWKHPLRCDTGPGDTEISLCHESQKRILLFIPQLRRSPCPVPFDLVFCLCSSFLCSSFLSWSVSFPKERLQGTGLLGVRCRGLGFHLFLHSINFIISIILLCEREERENLYCIQRWVSEWVSERKQGRIYLDFSTGLLIITYIRCFFLHPTHCFSLESGKCAVSLLLTQEWQGFEAWIYSWGDMQHVHLVHIPEI